MDADQIDYLFFLLRTELESWFGGNTRPRYPSPEIKSLIYGAKREYLVLYDLLRDEWEGIIKLGLTADVTLTAQTPGQMLIKILEEDQQIIKARFQQLQYKAILRPLCLKACKISNNSSIRNTAKAYERSTAWARCNCSLLYLKLDEVV